MSLGSAGELAGAPNDRTRAGAGSVCESNLVLFGRVADIFREHRAEHLL